MSRTIPRPSKISRPFWESCKSGRMQMQRCEDCGVYVYYPVYVCPECASQKLAWTPVTGRGKVYTYTVAAKASFETEGPMVLALVELEEGAMMVSNIVNTPPESVHIGMPVRIAYEPISDEITLPLFQAA